MINENKIKLDEILDAIKKELNSKRITNGHIEVVLSWYNHVEDKVDFTLSRSDVPVIKKINNITFYIYDDFYLHKDYYKYNHITFKEVGLFYRVDYRSIKSKDVISKN